MSVFAQESARVTKAYEDVRFRVSYMRWDGADAAPYQPAGPAVVVFLDDGGLKASPLSAVERHRSGEVKYIDVGASVPGGTIASGARLRAVLVELKNIGSSRPLQASTFMPAFPRADTIRVLENDRVIVWDILYRPDEQLPQLLHTHNSIQVWLSEATIERAYANQAPHAQARDVGAWEMLKAGLVASERVVNRPARAVAIELK